MVTCSLIVDGGRWEREAEQAMKTSRTLVYDVETGSLRYSKSRAALNSRSESPDPSFTTSSFELGNDQLGVDSPAQHNLLGKLHSGGGSGESSPTCVIQNSALRSNSSSPTMSSISKASSDPGRKSHELEGRYSRTKFARTASSPEYDEEFVSGVSPGAEPQKIGDVRGRKKLGVNTSGRPGLKGPPLQRMENDSSVAKENGWSMPLDTSRGALKEAQTPPFKSIQCAVADKTMEAAKKNKHGGNPVSVSRPSSQSASIMHKSPGIFSFNATYMSRADSDLDDLDQIHGDTPKEVIDLSRRTFMVPLLKPTPSKWDDAEKWLPGSETLNPARTKSRSGPLLAQMVASQAGMSIPWKGPLFCQNDRLNSGIGQRVEAEDSGSDAVVKSVATANVKPSVTGVDIGGLIDFTADEKEQLNLLLDRYSVESVQSRGVEEVLSDGSTSPSCMNGSFMKLGAPMEKPLVKFLPETLDSGSKTQFVSTRDTGTAMTPIPSVEPSRTGTPLRATTPEKRPDDEAVSSLEHSRMTVNCDNDADATSKYETAESPRTLTEKELQEKTRQEIVALGTQLGKANIAAAWAAREAKESAIIRKSSKTALELENIRRDVFASRADAWKEAEKAKYTCRFQQEEAKIQAWEDHEKAKAEAQMRRVEAKVERMKAQAHEKLANKLAAARRQAEELRLAAETRRTEAAAKAARKAERMKTNGKITNLLFLSFLCT